MVGFLENQQYNKISDVPGQELTPHIVSAVTGFFRSISLRNENALQDTLRLLTLWFKYGAHDDVSHAMSNGFTDVEVDTWLEVIPQVCTQFLWFNSRLPISIQIIASIQTPSNNIRRNINTVLTEVGKHHPQALVYALTVASKSSSTVRKNAALHIMDRMREHSPVIVEQALLVSHELVRVAILWHELWHEGLEEASRLYFTDHNPMGMIAFLEPLHDMLEVCGSRFMFLRRSLILFSRVPKLRARSRSRKSLVVISMKHGKRVDDTPSTAKNVTWRRPGRSTME